MVREAGSAPPVPVGEPVPAGAAATKADIAGVFRQDYGRAVAVLTRVLGEIDAAEDAVQEAFTLAVRHWPSTGLPPSPAGWIITTARNGAIDRLRREAGRGDKQLKGRAAGGRPVPGRTDARGTRDH
ncbi:MAG TPA: sigma factor [Arthrobacter sp.]|nr:sigma factor [Arthrobacter sp.]